MSEVKTVIIERAVPHTVMFYLTPVLGNGNPILVKLTKTAPRRVINIDWGLSIFTDPGVNQLYMNGNFVIKNKEEVVAYASEMGFVVDDNTNSVTRVEDVSMIKTIIKSGNRANIQNAIEKYGEQKVKDVVINCADELPVSIVNMLESILHIQLTMDGGAI